MLTTMRKIDIKKSRFEINVIINIFYINRGNNDNNKKIKFAKISKFLNTTKF